MALAHGGALTQREERRVVGHQRWNPIGLHAAPVHGRSQLDEVVGGRHRDDQDTGALEHPGGFRRIPPRVQRQDDPDRSVEQRQPPVGVGDDPDERREPVRGAFDGRNREIDSDARDGLDGGHSVQRPAGAAAKVHDHGLVRQTQVGHPTHDVIDERTSDPSRFERRAGLDGRLAVPGLPRLPVLRLQQVHVTRPRHVVAVTVRAGERAVVPREPTRAATDGASKRRLNHVGIVARRDRVGSCDPPSRLMVKYPVRLIIMLRAGIVGLPNVGKSTLFNAVTRTRKAEAANYPFCTIDPNVGMVTVPDTRLPVLQGIAGTQVVIPAVIEFVDIAGLVSGASQGEGLGNKFLTHIREVDAIVQVVRCFEDEDVHHVAGVVDPVRDIEVINTELMLADLESVTKKRERVSKEARRGDKAAMAEEAVLARLSEALEAGRPALTVQLSPEEHAISKQFFLLSDKPTIFACNVKEDDLAAAGANPYVVRVREYVRTHLACEAIVISAQIESELVDLPPAEADAFLAELGVKESGVGALIRSTYHLLGLQTYFTAGEKQVRAWTVRLGDTAPQAAGVIHTDFARGFIKAETAAYTDLVACGSVAAAREKGLYRMEGKEYVVKDGDVMLFKFNV